MTPKRVIEEVALTGHDDRVYPTPYGQDPYQAPVVVRPVAPTSGLAVASLITGLFSALGGCCLLGLPCILAVILGHMAIRETRNGQRGGHGMAVAGLILGYVFVIPGILLMIQLLAGGAATILEEAGS